MSVQTSDYPMSCSLVSCHVTVAAATAPVPVSMYEHLHTHWFFNRKWQFWSFVNSSWSEVSSFTWTVMILSQCTVLWDSSAVWCCLGFLWRTSVKLVSILTIMSWSESLLSFSFLVQCSLFIYPFIKWFQTHYVNYFRQIYCILMPTNP